MDKGIRIKLADPGIDAPDQEAVREVLGSGRLVTGPKCESFEASLKGITTRKHATVLSSGTTALLAAMKALGIGKGSTVIVPGFTFPAPAAVAAFLGARVLVCDVDKATFCISQATLEPYLDDHVSLVVAIDQFGMPAPVPELTQLLEPREIPLLVDAACSIGSTLNKRPCGSFGAAATFSFHPRKVVTTGEGGAVLTDREDIAKSVRRIVNHGLEGGEFTSIGLNLRLSEIGAAIGLSQVGRLDTILTRRRALARRYKVLPFRFQEPPLGAETNYQTLAAVLPEPLGTKDRGDLLRELLAHGIEANIASYCLGALPAIARHLGLDCKATPVALGLHERAFALPLHPSMIDSDVDEVVQVVHNWLKSRQVG